MLDHDAIHRRDAPDVQLRPMHDDDWPQLRSWLARPDIEQWWGPRASSEAAVLLAMGATQAICCMIEVERHAVGYGQAVDATLWGEALPDGLIPGTWDIDLFIASRPHRNRGIGSRALAMLRDQVFASTLAPAVCIFASISNERAVRAYEKAGFRWRSVVQNRAQGPEWFMLAERPAR